MRCEWDDASGAGTAAAVHADHVFCRSSPFGLMTLFGQAEFRLFRILLIKSGSGRIPTGRSKIDRFYFYSESVIRRSVGGMLPLAPNGSSANAVASLYRTFVREIENLPTRYLRSVAIEHFRECWSYPITPAGNSIKSRSRMTSKPYPVQSLPASNRGSSASRGYVSA